MKTIKNQKVKLKNSGKETSFGEILRDCVNVIPQNGLTTEDIIKRIQVLTAIKESEDGKTDIKLEDADHATALKCVTPCVGAW